MDNNKVANRSAEAPLSPSFVASKTTPELEEGPYYKSGSPKKTRLYQKGIPGEPLTLTGYVSDHTGKTIAHAWMDFWQANGNGEYDNSGYTLRGHQYTDETGKYILQTVLPGGYSVRTPHIHVKVRANDDAPVLTTQLFIPGLASNKTDFLYRDDLQIQLKDAPKGKTATFNFKLKH